MKPPLSKIERVDMELSHGQSSPLQDLAQDLSVKKQTSPPVHEGLVGIFNGLLSEKMPDDTIKAKLDKYTRNKNIKGLRTPKVNPLIWNQLSTTMKAQDATMRDKNVETLP